MKTSQKEVLFRASTGTPELELEQYLAGYIVCLVLLRQVLENYEFIHQNHGWK